MLILNWILQYRFRDKIQESSMSELKDFLENVRKHSNRIGRVAMKHVSP